MLGDLSAEYESNGDPSTISSGYGDYGGKSYGCYQFASNAGVPQDFVRWLCSIGHWFGTELSKEYVGSDSFDGLWGYFGNTYPDEFAELQHNYTKRAYFDSAVDNLADIGFNVLSKSEAIQQVIWSRSVQYSAGNIVELFELASDLAGIPLNSIDDYNLIYYIYEVNLTNQEWCQGSSDVILGLKNRFRNEREKALAMLGGIT